MNRKPATDISRSFFFAIFFVIFFSMSLCWGPGAGGYAAAADVQSVQRAPVNPAFTERAKSEEEGILPSGVAEGRSPSYVISPLLPRKHASGARLKGVAEPQALPSKYDMRDPNGTGNPSESLLTPVKDEGDCAASWAFASYGSLESHRKMLFGVDDSYSEQNLICCHGFDFGPCSGGNVQMTAAYLSRFDGPIDTAVEPYDPPGHGCTLHTPGLYFQNLLYLPVRADTTDNDYIKQAVLAYGGLLTTIYWDHSFYNSTTSTYYLPYLPPPAPDGPVNEGMVIVGWDDNMTVAPAPGQPSPKGPGAFIIRDDRGTSFGDGGYFYISYYDKALAFYDLAASLDMSDQTPDFDTVYYYDKLGMTDGINLNGSSTGWAANVFTAVESSSITSIGFFISEPGTNYTVYIYRDFDGRSFSDLLATTGGSADYPGYYTIPLDNPVDLGEGYEFSVIVKFQVPHPEWYPVFPIAIEAPIKHYSSNARAKAGQSYVSLTGDYWTDLTKMWGFKNCNVCVKAYTRAAVFPVPVADFTTTPSPALIGQEVTFTDATTGPVDSWQWDFGDNKKSWDQNPRHVFNKAGVYNVTLTASGVGGSNFKTIPLTVNEPPPEADFKGGPKLTGKAPLKVNFTDKSKNKITEWKWDFGDSPPVIAGKNVSHVYASAGVYTVTLTVTGPGGQDSKTLTDYINVYNQPVAAFSATPTKGPAPLTVVFANSSSGDIDSYLWNFGDQSSSVEKDPPAHTYTRPGSYKVTLTTTNNLGGTSKTSKTIKVTKP